jgi:hypothetical protein
VLLTCLRHYGKIYISTENLHHNNILAADLLFIALLGTELHLTLNEKKLRKNNKELFGPIKETYVVSHVNRMTVLKIFFRIRLRSVPEKPDSQLNREKGDNCSKSGNWINE